MPAKYEQLALFPGLDEENISRIVEKLEYDYSRFPMPWAAKRPVNYPGAYEIEVKQWLSRSAAIDEYVNKNYR